MQSINDVNAMSASFCAIGSSKLCSGEMFGFRGSGPVEPLFGILNTHISQLLKPPDLSGVALISGGLECFSPLKWGNKVAPSLFSAPGK